MEIIPGHDPEIRSELLQLRLDATDEVHDARWRAGPEDEAVPRVDGIFGAYWSRGREGVGNGRGASCVFELLEDGIDADAREVWRDQAQALIGIASCAVRLVGLLYLRLELWSAHCSCKGARSELTGSSSQASIRASYGFANSGGGELLGDVFLEETPDRSSKLFTASVPIPVKMTGSWSGGGGAIVWRVLG